MLGRRDPRDLDSGGEGTPSEGFAMIPKKPGLGRPLGHERSDAAALHRQGGEKTEFEGSALAVAVLRL